jgi:hypothetical protein
MQSLAKLPHYEFISAYFVKEIPHKSERFLKILRTFSLHGTKIFTCTPFNEEFTVLLALLLVYIYKSYELEFVIPSYYRCLSEV